MRLSMLTSSFALFWVGLPWTAEAGPTIPEPTAYWTFDADDVIGNRILDSVGTFDGEIPGANDRNPIELRPGRFGEALRFPGRGDNFFNYVDCGDVLDPGFESFTVSLWFNADVIANQPQFLIHKGNNDSAVPGWSIWIGEGNGRIHCRGNWCADDEDNPDDPACDARNEDGKFGLGIDDQSGLAGEYHHLAMVIDRENEVVRAYLDGSNEGWVTGLGGPGPEEDFVHPDAIIAPKDGLEGSNPTLIMGRRFSSGAPFGGQLDDIAIWQGTALTEEQILALASGTPPVAPPPDNEPPAVPSGLTTVPEDGRISLDWADNTESDLGLYNVKRSVTPSGAGQTTIGEALVSEFVDDQVQNGTTYYYVVSARDRADNESGDSDRVSETPMAGLDVTAPPAPLRLRAFVDSGVVRLRWDGVTDAFPTDGPLQGYNVKRSLTEGGPHEQLVEVAGETTELGDTTVTNGTTYFYVVTAVDPVGNESAASNEINATPSPFSCPGLPVAYYTLDAADIVEDVVFDSVGTFDGTIMGTEVTNPLGMVGEALGFPDTETDFVDFGNVPLEPEMESFTVSLWFNAGTEQILSGVASYLISKGNGSSDDIGWSIWIGEGSGRIHCRGHQEGAVNTEKFGQSIDDQGALEGDWHHIAYVIDRDNDVVRGYLDGSNEGWLAGGGGAQVDTLIPLSNIVAPENLLMGRRSQPGAPYLGLIDDVAIWNEALEPRQIQALAEGVIEPTRCGVEFNRGDADADGQLVLTDGVFTLRFLFLGADPPPCRDAADADDNGELTLNDAVFFFNFLFAGSAPPPAPFGDVCGPDPTDDDLGCEAFPGENCL